MDRGIWVPTSDQGTSGVVDWRRSLPSVERVLSAEEAAPIGERYGRAELKRAVGEVLDCHRRSSTPVATSPSAVIAEAEGLLKTSDRLPLRRLINATGIIIHTNLGRAPIAPAIVDEARELLAEYCNLEMDVESGGRGRRNEHLRELCGRLFGCEAALLVNNNAAATMLAVAAVAGGREVIVSRGELVEIGGGFRVPEVIEQGGAKLREVGTTNRTRGSDFGAATGPLTAALLRVHRSNFEISGFTEQPTIEELVAVARGASVPLVYDEGSGRVVDLAPWGFTRAHTLAELFTAGVDLVTCSTDKLIGASQGGLILGRQELVDRCARHPLMRAVRAGKETFAIVAATLRRFVQETHQRDVTIYRMLSYPISDLRSRAERLASLLQWDVREVRSALGGGTTPAETMSSIAIAVADQAGERAASLRRGAVAVIGRVENGELLLDLRTVLPEQDGELERMIRASA